MGNRKYSKCLPIKKLLDDDFLPFVNVLTNALVQHTHNL